MGCCLPKHVVVNLKGFNFIEKISRAYDTISLDYTTPTRLIQTFIDTLLRVMTFWQNMSDSEIELEDRSHLLHSFKSDVTKRFIDGFDNYSGFSFMNTYHRNLVICLINKKHLFINKKPYPSEVLNMMDNIVDTIKVVMNQVLIESSSRKEGKEIIRDEVKKTNFLMNITEDKPLLSFQHVMIEDVEEKYQTPTPSPMSRPVTPIGDKFKEFKTWNTFEWIRYFSMTYDCTCPECTDMIDYPTYIGSPCYILKDDEDTILCTTRLNKIIRPMRTKVLNFHRFFRLKILSFEPMKYSDLNLQFIEELIPQTPTNHIDGYNDFSYKMRDNQLSHLWGDLTVRYKALCKSIIFFPKLLFDLHETWMMQDFKSDIVISLDNNGISYKERSSDYYTFVSHVWETKEDPDPLRQYTMISLIRYKSVWIDFLSLPQKTILKDKMTTDHKVLFDETIKNMFSIQFTSKSVKITTNKNGIDYFKRAWCIAEQTLIGPCPILDTIKKLQMLQPLEDILKQENIHIEKVSDLEIIKSYFGIKGGYTVQTQIIYGEVVPTNNIKIDSSLKHATIRDMPWSTNIYQVEIIVNRGTMIYIEDLDGVRTLIYDKIWNIGLSLQNQFPEEFKSLTAFYRKHHFKKARWKMSTQKPTKLYNNLRRGLKKGLFTTFLQSEISSISTEYFSRMFWVKTNFFVMIIRDVLWV